MPGWSTCPHGYRVEQVAPDPERPYEVEDVAPTCPLCEGRPCSTRYVRCAGAPLRGSRLARGEETHPS
jgi:hypothetical protein